MKIKILETDDRLGIKKGEIYNAKRYHFDPTEKMELIGRDDDGYDPMCNVYIDSVAHMIQGRWHLVKDGRYVEQVYSRRNEQEGG